MGSGNVHLKSYRGKLSNDGMADVRIDGTAMPPPPEPPVPSHPVQPPAPPAPPHHSSDDDDDN
jgi:hypothetical protein